MSRPRSRVRFEASLVRPAMRLQPRTIPSVDPWVAGEMFVSQHLQERVRGFAILLGSEGLRRSPLTVQLLTARLDEADLGLRCQIIQAIGDYFELRGSEYRYPADVRAGVAAQLRKFDRPEMQALLEAHLAAHEGAGRLTLDAQAHVLERVPAASALLVKLAYDRSVAVHIRRAAIDLLGKIGFTDALSALEGLQSRIAGRQAGQLAMAFAPADYADEGSLLPILQTTLDVLRDDA